MAARRGARRGAPHGARRGAPRALTLLAVACLAAPAAGFSEGLKAVTRVAESTYFVSHHDGNVLVRFDNTTTEIVAGSPEGRAGDEDGLEALLHGPQGLVFDGGDSIYFVDTFNSKLKRFAMSSGAVATVAALGPASPIDSNKQGSNGAPFPIGVDVDAATRLAFVSLKYGKAVLAVDLDAAENATKRTSTPAWAAPYVAAAGSGTGAVAPVALGCALDNPHGLSVRGATGRLLVADDSAGVRVVDLGAKTCATLGGAVSDASFRDVAWIDDATAWGMERGAAGTLYAWDVDADRSHAVFGGGREKTCWRDGAGLLAPDTRGSGFWKAMAVSYDAARWPDSVLVADTGANFLRRLAVAPGDLFRDAAATTVPCFATAHRLTECNAGTSEHFLCGLGDGPFPEQLPPCLPCMNASLGTWCACDAYRDAPWCAPRLAALSPRARAYVRGLNGDSEDD